MPVRAVIRSTLAAAIFAVSSLVGQASAVPLAPAAYAPAGLVQLAAHDKHHWFWEHGWWRYGPWSDHAIVGTVVSPRWPVGTVWQHWGAERLRVCAERYRSFDPVTGTYLTPRGERMLCRVAPLK